MTQPFSVRTSAHAEVAIDLERLLSVTAYKKDLFRPQCINLRFQGEGFEHEWDGITYAQGLMITRALAQVHPQVVPFDRWWEQVTNPLRRDDEIRVFRKRPG